MSLYWLVNVVLGEIQLNSICFLRIFLQDSGWIRQTIALPDLIWNKQDKFAAPPQLHVNKENLEEK